MDYILLNIAIYHRYVTLNTLVRKLSYFLAEILVIWLMKCDGYLLCVNWIWNVRFACEKKLFSQEILQPLKLFENLLNNYISQVSIHLSSIPGHQKYFKLNSKKIVFQMPLSGFVFFLQNISKPIQFTSTWSTIVNILCHKP